MKLGQSLLGRFHGVEQPRNASFESCPQLPNILHGSCGSTLFCRHLVMLHSVRDVVSKRDEVNQLFSERATQQELLRISRPRHLPTRFESMLDLILLAFEFCFDLRTQRTTPAAKFTCRENARHGKVSPAPFAGFAGLAGRFSAFACRRLSGLVNDSACECADREHSLCPRSGSRPPVQRLAYPHGAVDCIGNAYFDHGRSLAWAETQA